MLFKRKKKLSTSDKIKNFLFPKKGILRGYKYLLKRLFLLKGNTRSISLGASFGISIAITPLFGLQIFLTILFDFLFKANLTASMLFTIVGNPLTFPFIWFADYKLGSWILSKDTLDGSSFSKTISEIETGFHNSNWELITENLTSIFYPMLLGGIVFAIILGILTYIFVFKSLSEYRELKFKKMEKVK